MKNKIYIFLDDEREEMYNQISANKDFLYVHCYTYEEAINVLKLADITNIVIDFDNDLGTVKEGYDVAKYIVENQIPLLYFKIHSMNPVARKNIYELLTHYGYKFN